MKRSDPGSSGSLPHELLERRLVADRVEVGVIGRQRPEARCPVDRVLEVLDGVGPPPGEALAARQVVGQVGVLRMGRDELGTAVGDLLELPGLVERVERRPKLPAARLVRLPGRPAQGDERRPGFLGERRPLHAGAGEDERPGRRVHLLAVELESRPALLDEVELLVGVLLRLVVLVDQPFTRLTGAERVGAERHDPEMLPDRPPGTATVADLVDLVELCNGIAAHRASWSWFLCKRSMLTRVDSRWRDG